MDKYQELHGIFVQDMQAYYRYSEQCLQFTNDLVARMTHSYLGWQPEDVYCVNWNERSNPRQFNLLKNATENLSDIPILIQEDFWTFGIRLDLRNKQAIAGTYPESIFIVPLLIRKKKGLFNVKFEEQGDEYKGATADEFDELFEEVYSRIKKILKLNVQILLGRDEVRGEFTSGFIIDSDRINKLEKYSKEKLQSNQTDWLGSLS